MKTTAVIACLLFAVPVVLGDGDIMGEAPEPDSQAQAVAIVENGLILFVDVGNEIDGQEDAIRPNLYYHAGNLLDGVWIEK